MIHAAGKDKEESVTEIYITCRLCFCGRGYPWMIKKLIGIFIYVLLLCSALTATSTVLTNDQQLNPPYGPTEGLVGVNYIFCFDLPDDPECEHYYVMWDWGDGHVTSWIGPYSAGETVCANHSWTEPGDYDIRVKIRDGCGNEYWSDPLIIHIYLEPVLEIGKITGAFWKIGAEITNIGDYNATNVNWEIYTHKLTITPIYFGGGTIPIFKSGETGYVSHFGPLFGFGKFDIIVEVECQNVSAEKIVRAFMFFVFVIV